MKYREGLIEYVGISKSMPSPNIYEQELNLKFSMSNNISEIIKLQSEMEIVDFQKVCATKGICTVKLSILVEYIEDKFEQVLCGSEKITMVSFIINFSNEKNLENIKGYILNIKAKYMNKKDLFIYFKVGIDF